MLQEWCILGVGKGVLFREVSSVQGCGCIGVQLKVTSHQFLTDVSNGLQ